MEDNSNRSVDTEISVLGCILANNNIWPSVQERLRPHCFSDEVLAMVFKLTADALTEGKRVSPLSVYSANEKAIGEANRPLVSSLPGYANFVTLKDDVDLLVTLYTRRRTIALAHNLIADVNNQQDSETTIVSRHIQELTNVALNSSGNTGRTGHEVAADICEEYRSPEDVYCAKTSIACLDNAMRGGMRRGKVYAFMAAAKIGKTTLAITISDQLDRDGHKHLFVCAEMGSKEIMERVLAGRMGVSTARFEQKGDHNFHTRMCDEQAKLGKFTIFEDEPNIEFDRLKTLVDYYVYKEKIEGFILDYFQLVEGGEKGKTEASHLERVGNWLHKVCKKHNIWCLLLVQSNEDKKVLGSRGLYRACDQLYLIERPLDDLGVPKGQDAWLKLIVSRYASPNIFLGDAGEPYLEMNSYGTRFRELPYHAKR